MFLNAMRGFGLASVFALVSVQAFAADKKIVTIQPIQLARNDGSGLVEATTFESYAKKIWAQADIELNFLPSRILNSTTFYNLNYNNANSLFFGAGNQQHSDPFVINAYFANTITNASVYGFALLDDNFMALDVTNIKGFSALGRVDTFAHELGHNLTLPHYSGSNASRHLMAAGGTRLIPQTLGDVAPDGAGLDFLSQNEINAARNSQFAKAAPVPEPATLLAVGTGLVALCRRRRRSA